MPADLAPGQRVPIPCDGCFAEEEYDHSDAKEQRAGSQSCVRALCLASALWNG